MVEYGDYEAFIGGPYAAEVDALVDAENPGALYIEYEDLLAHDSDLAETYRTNPDRAQSYFERALRGYDGSLQDVTVRVTDAAERMDRLGLPDLEAHHIGSYIAITGQLSKVTAKQPLLVEGAFECNACGAVTRVQQPRHDTEQPTDCEACDEGGSFRLNVAQSQFVDQRKIKLQTPPDEAAQGEGVDTTVYVTGDLCDYGGANGIADRAGEQCTVFGVRRLVEADLYGRNASPEPETWFEGQAIQFHGDDHGDVDLEEHEADILEIAEREDPITAFRENIAPALEADEDLTRVLEGAVAWLFRSYRVEQEEGQYRGDIHMAIIGDPGTGKSTLLSELSEIAPVCEFRSGTGLSKVGLTAAAIREEFGGTSKWTLKPGILPRANGGYCIIDEVDDVVDEKTKAIHDALEGDQMIKIDKAGIKADLETRTSLLASGNPKSGRFSDFEPIPEQIDLDAALIDRMDVMLDLPDELDAERDRKKADHYLESYDEISRRELVDRGEIGDEELKEQNAAERDIPIETLRAWVAYANQYVFPRLTEEAKADLKEFYLETRDLNGGYEDGDDGVAIPTTLRTLGAGVRLATAYARCELSETVEPRHVERAKEVTKGTIGLSWDPASGEFDANKVDSKTMNRGSNEKQLIADMVENNGGDPVDLEDALGVLTAKFDYDASKARHQIDKLKQKGEVYEPETNKIKTT